MISITVNDKNYTTERDNLFSFLQEIGFGNLNELAIAVNDQIVQKSQISMHKLNENDKITLIRITCGG